MLIEIKPHALGGVWVIAHTKSGKAFDYFKTQKEGVEFARSFYGGEVTYA